MFNTILCELAEGILTITLNRPDKLNAFNVEMMRELLEAFERADRDDAVRAIIVTGAGRGFCSGVDLSGGSDTLDFDRRADKISLGSPLRADGSVDYSHEAVRDNGGRFALRIFASLKPVIGAINGAAVGIGFTMTLPMDIRIAADTAKFAAPFARRGIVPEAGSTWFLPRLVGISRAMEWCLSGSMISAQEALTAGLLRSVVSQEELLPLARELARKLTADSAPVSVSLTRQMLWRGLIAADPMDAHRIESRGVYVRGRSRDAKEGIASYLEKRPPKFPNTVSSDMPDFFPWWPERGYE